MQAKGDERRRLPQHSGPSWNREGGQQIFRGRYSARAVRLPRKSFPKLSAHDGFSARKVHGMQARAMVPRQF